MLQFKTKTEGGPQIFCIGLFTTLPQRQGHLAFQRHSEPVVRTFSPSRFLQQGGILLGQLPFQRRYRLKENLLGERGGGQSYLAFT